MAADIKEKNLVSVLMATHSESKEILMQSIQSIEQQTYKNIELILVNDGNVNIEYLKNNMHMHNIKIINNTGIGLVDALNQGLKEATGVFVARMDADDISHPNRIEKSVDFLMKFGLDLMATDINYMDIEGNIIRKGNIKSMFGHDLIDILKRVNIMNHPTWLVRKELYINNAGYLSFYKNEDWNFILRAIDKGYKLGFLGEALLNYRIGPNKLTTSSGLYHSNFTFNNLKSIWLTGNINKYLPEMDDSKFNLINIGIVKKRERFITIVFRNVNNHKRQFTLSNLLDSWTYLYLFNILLNRYSIRKVQKHDD
ncbi:MAG: glycosyltransferase [Leuconostoc gelidum]|jgi:glycosyltransferase involved in cell wall biosynthesis|uniref:glycosyltransferase n=1 Tax=Leuconostoc gelidum TaxID=1244 RepID=UPI002F36075C